MENKVALEEDLNVLRSEASFFAEWDFVKSFIKEICTENWEEMWTTKWEMLSSILLVFQEQPSLLSPYLEEIIVPLTSELIHILEKEEKLTGRRFQRMASMQFHALCKVLQLFCRVRGYKSVIKFFPHEVSHVEVCMIALQSQDRTDHCNWETRYILLLWMCQLCLIPFDICSLDSTLSTHSTTDDIVICSERVSDDDSPNRNVASAFSSPSMSSASQSRLVCDIITLAREHLSESGPTREAAYACLSALFTRPDMESTLLHSFMCWCCERLDAWCKKGENAESELTHDSFQLIGVLHTMSNIFKKGHRNNVLPYAHMALNPCLRLSDQNNQTLVRKLLIKVIQRIGLIFLPPKEAAWRYQRGSRSLLTNLNQTTSSAVGCVETGVDKGFLGGSVGGEEEEFEVPAELEEIVERLLCSVQDKDTVVRWSAAKGIGRVTMRLPLEFGDDVVGAVVDVFEDAEDESAWHGGCLALAELSRRGLLLPARLEAVVPIVVRAMHFDLRRGQHSVGSHVRDAASYVCWAFARAYAPEVLKPFVGLFSEAMLLAALFDREINCRRAASAAFQENVGRQGNENFPFGIEVIAVADYFSLGNRNNAYLTIAPTIATLSPLFNEFIVKHLYTSKLSHWDSEIRTLAAKSLGMLTKINPQCCLDALGPILTECVSAKAPAIARHGGVLAVGEIVLALSMNNKMSNVDSDNGDIIGSDAVSVVTIPQKIVTDCFEVVGKLDKGRMYRGGGGEQLREASCKLVEKIARSQLSMPLKVQVALVEHLNENLKQPHEHVQRAAAKALRQMLFSYFPVNATTGPSERLQSLTVMKYMTGAKTELNVAVVRGYTLALGALPSKLLVKPDSRLREVMDCLGEVMDPEHRIAGESDAEAKRNAVESVAELGERLVGAGCLSGGVEKWQVECDSGGSGSAFRGDEPDSTTGATSIAKSIELVSVRSVLHLLTRACEDYSIDKRGDTGSWCRVVGMRGLERFINAVLRSVKYSPLLTRHPEAVFSNVVMGAERSEVIVGSHVMTAFGPAVVVDMDGNVAGTVAVRYPPQSLGAVMCTKSPTVSSGDVETFLVKLSKSMLLLGQSCVVKTDVDESDDDEIGDHLTRQAMLESFSVSSGVTAKATEEEFPLPVTVLPPPSSCLIIGEEEMQTVVGVLLKQLGEKLDSVREIAGGVLERLIESTDPYVNMIPDKKVIQDSLSQLKEDILAKNAVDQKARQDISGKIIPTSKLAVNAEANAVNWTRSAHVFSFLVAALDSSYFDDIISGMIISVGGLSEDVVKDSLDALLKWCLHKKGTKNLRDLGSLSTALINILNQFQRNSRVTLPLMKCACALLRNGIFDFLHCDSTNVVSGKYADNSSSFGVNLLRAVARELSNCGELVKIRTGIDLYCLMLMFEDPLRPGALKSLLMLLGHRYPKVRKYAAEQLYVQFISDPCAVGEGAAAVKEKLERVSVMRQDVDTRQLEKRKQRQKLEQEQEGEVDDGTRDRDVSDINNIATRSGFSPSQELLDAACEVLTVTVWNDTLDQARTKRGEVCALLGVELNIRQKKGREGDEKKEQKADELDSYDSLVKEAGY